MAQANLKQPKLYPTQLQLPGHSQHDPKSSHVQGKDDTLNPSKTIYFSTKSKTHDQATTYAPILIWSRSEGRPGSTQHRHLITQKIQCSSFVEMCQAPCLTQTASQGTQNLRIDK